MSRPPPRLRTLDIGEVFFFRVDQTLEVTLAMEAGLTDHVWSWRNWWDYWNDRKCGQRHEMAILDRLICQRIDGASLCLCERLLLTELPVILARVVARDCATFGGSVLDDAHLQCLFAV